MTQRDLMGIVAAMPPLSCPFCGAAAVVRTDAVVSERTFYVRCERTGCVGSAIGPALGWIDPDAAIAAWNQRRGPVEPAGKAVADVIGFTKRSMIRGEMIALQLDDRGRLLSDEVEFTWSNRLSKRPQDT